MRGKLLTQQCEDVNIALAVSSKHGAALPPAPGEARHHLLPSQLQDLLKLNIIRAEAGQAVDVGPSVTVRQEEIPVRRQVKCFPRYFTRSLLGER